MSYVLDILLAIVFGFAVVTLVIGLIVLIAPDKIQFLADRLDKTISTDRYFNVLDKGKYLDRYFYRYHHWVGIFIIVGAAYTLIILFPHFGSYQSLPEIINPVVSSWLYDALVISLLFLCILALFIGVIIFIRPSAIKSFEAKMNAWKDTSRLVKPLDQDRYLEQQRPLKKPRVIGLIILAGSIYVLWYTAPYVFN